MNDLDNSMVNDVVELQQNLSHLLWANSPTLQGNRAANLLETYFKSIRDRFNYGEFTERETIGEGSFGIVQSANWKSRGLKVALKSLKGGVALDDKAAREFVKEVRSILNF